MPIISRRKPKVGNLLKHESLASIGWARNSLVALLDEDSVVGTVFKSDEDGTYSPVVAADVAGLSALTAEFKLAINMDFETELLGVGDQDVACLTGGLGGSGAVDVAREALVFGDTLTEAQVDEVVRVLGTQAIRALRQV